MPHGMINARLHQLAEGQYGLDELSCALFRRSDGPVRHVNIEIADEHHNGITISHVRNVVPPVSQPVLAILSWLGGARLKSSLKFCSLLGLQERLDARLGGLERGRREVRLDTLKIFWKRGGERGDGERRNRFLETQHGADVGVDRIAWGRRGVGRKRARSAGGHGEDKTPVHGMMVECTRLQGSWGDELGLATVSAS